MESSSANKIKIPFGFRSGEKQRGEVASATSVNSAPANSATLLTSANAFKGESSSGSSLSYFQKDPVLARVENFVKENRDNPNSLVGVNYLRGVLNLDLILSAPENYFDRFLPIVEECAENVRTSIVEESSERVPGNNGAVNKNQADMLNEVRKKPTDEALESIYGIVNAYTLNAIGKVMKEAPLSPGEIEIIKAMVFNEVAGYSIIEPLWRNESITEIACNGPYDIQIEIAGEMQKLNSINFRNAEHLESLLGKIYGAIGKEFTVSTAQLKGRFYDMSRIFCTGRSISPAGPNVSIRRHPKEYWSPESMIKFGASDEAMMTFLGNLIYKGGNFLVIGGTSTGKTSMFNALTGFYKPKARILTMEDNLEMKPNPKKYLAAPLECKPPSKEKGGDPGIDMRDLVKGSLQMKPHVILIGEITDGACYDLIQALNTGHSGACTIHANDAKSAMPRIASLFVQSGLGTYEDAYTAIAEAVDVLVVLKYFGIDGSRRIVSIDEVDKEPVTIDGRITLGTRPLYRFVDEGLDENGKVKGYWEHLSDLSKERVASKYFDIEPDKTWEELRELSSIPEGYLVK